MNPLQNYPGLFKKSLSTQEKEKIADMLADDPELLKQFEKSYSKVSVEGPFGPSAKDAVDEGRTMAEAEVKAYTEKSAELQKLCRRITDELLCMYRCLPGPETLVTSEDLKAVPLNMRPQLTSTMMKTDTPQESAAAMVLEMLRKCLLERNPKKAMQLYGMFRQGLDVLDLNPVLYTMLGRNPNSIGNWFPALKTAADKHSFFKIPETKIVRVPLPILQMSRIEFSELTLATKEIVNQFCMKAFDLDPEKTYFIKTGVFSCKFDFRNCKVSGEKEVRELGEYLLYISSLASQMAGPLNQTCMYGAATTNEWAVREYIEDKENNPTIYHGMPLHPEYRVFIDCDTNEILGVSPYWRPDIMKKRFGGSSDSSHPDMVHDYIIYAAHEPVLMQRYADNVDKVVQHVAELVPDLNLKGQWSLDVMQNGDEFYLIDMATADVSAMNDVVLENKLKKDPMPMWCIRSAERILLTDG